MTLSTDLYILDEIDPHEVFRFCQQMLTKYDEHRRPVERQLTEDKRDGTWRDGEQHVDPANPWTIMTEPGQSLPAWTFVHYRPGAPLRTPEQAAEHEDYCESDCDGEHYRRACWLSIDWDTSYGFHGPDGMGCADLHAAFIGETGQWLDGQGIRWEWRNEYTGEVHGGAERYTSLAGFMSDGFAGTAWFETAVKPALGIR